MMWWHYTNHQSVTLRMKHAGNVGNWVTSNAQEGIRMLLNKERMSDPTCIPLRWVMKLIMTP